MTSAACCVTKDDGALLAVVVTLIFTPTFYRTGGVLSAHRFHRSFPCGCGFAALGLLLAINVVGCRAFWSDFRRIQ
jgi:hypothetical protein